MVAHSPIFRLILALLIAAWSPVCLCQGDRGHTHQTVTQTSGHSEHEDGSPCGCRHGDDGPAPCDHDKGSGCECPKLLATLAKPSTVLKAGLTAPAAVLSWGTTQVLVPSTNARLLRPDDRALKRAPTTLLGLHCALIV